MTDKADTPDGCGIQPISLWALAEPLLASPPRVRGWLRNIDDHIDALADLADAALAPWSLSPLSSASSDATLRFMSALLTQPDAVGGTLLAFAATHANCRPARSRDLFLAVQLNQQLLLPVDVVVLPARDARHRCNPFVVSRMRRIAEVAPELMQELALAVAGIKRGYGDALAFPDASTYRRISRAIDALADPWEDVGAIFDEGPAAKSGDERLARLEARHWARMMSRWCALQAVDHAGWLRTWLDQQLMWIDHIRGLTARAQAHRAVDLAMCTTAPMLLRCDLRRADDERPRPLFNPPHRGLGRLEARRDREEVRRRATMRQRCRRARLRARLATLAPTGGVALPPDRLLAPPTADTSMLSAVQALVTAHLK